MRSRSRPEWLSGTEADESPEPADAGAASIAAGLLDAQLAEADGVRPAVSTSGSAFQAILDDLVRVVGDDELAASVAAPSSVGAASVAAPPVAAASVAFTATEPIAPASAENTARAVPARAPTVVSEVPPPPALLRGRGDLTLVIGLGTDALASARLLADVIGDAEVRPGGSARAAAPRVDDRRGALRARADGVRRERPMVAAFGIAGGASGPVGRIAELADDLASIAPDQVWAVVDVSRKTEDTAAWVRAVDAILAVDALVITGEQHTATPASAAELGIPIGRLEDSLPSPAHRPG